MLPLISSSVGVHRRFVLDTRSVESLHWTFVNNVALHIQTGARPVIWQVRTETMRILSFPENAAQRNSAVTMLAAQAERRSTVRNAAGGRFVIPDRG
jgi:hypothetical protein